MNRDKLDEIIADKNEQRERTMVRSAESIIENIIGEQAKIVASQDRITELRKELSALEVTPINAAAILGGD